MQKKFNLKRFLTSVLIFAVALLCFSSIANLYGFLDFDSAEEPSKPEEPKFVIEAGRYMFNDSVDLSNEISQDISFECFDGGGGMYVPASSITINSNGVYFDESKYYFYDIDSYIWHPSQEIIVLADTSVSEEFYIWFTENTTFVE